MPNSTQPECAPVLALDIGNVCLQVDLPALVTAMGFDDLDEVQRYDPDGRFMHLSNQVECGQITVAKFLEQFGAHLPQPQTAEQTRITWQSLIGAELPGIAELVSFASEQGLRVVLISDICKLHYELVRQRLSWWPSIDGAVLSYEVGHLKPHPAMYETLEQEFCEGRPPLLYADDKECNIEGALARNWESYHFQTVAGLRQALVAQLS